MNKEETVAAPAEPHPLTPLENQLNGSQHNASAAVKAVVDYLESELAKVRAEFAQLLAQKKGGRGNE